ncbi:MAG: hypothetical protein AAB360_00455 [Patescibacteria group bacterium]
MEKETKEIIKLTTIELLAYLENRLDKVVVSLDDIFSRDHGYSRRTSGYAGPREVDWKNFRQKIYRLKCRGLIRKTIEKKRYYLEITKEGKETLKRRLAPISFKRPEKWDKKWRIVIYDVPENHRGTRDSIRLQLYRVGFEQIQKSVFIFPFECTAEINKICRQYGGRSCIKYMITDIIEGEESITEVFLDKEILSLSDLT